MNGAQVVAEILRREGTDFLSCYPRNPIIEPCAALDIRPILCRQERVGVGLADGYSRIKRGKKNGVFDKNGDFTPVSWDEAFDVMAEKFKAALKKRGPSGVGMFGSGQWTIWEGYAAAKLFKAGFRSNNIDPNARHCMASAVAGFMRTFGIDEPMGCYDDIEHADAFVLWGSNMAEMHPILWSRITDRRLTAKHVRLNVLSTFSHRSCERAQQDARQSREYSHQAAKSRSPHGPT